MQGRQPAIFVAHGGGPLPVISPERQGGLSKHLRDLGRKLQASRPKALVVVSAHWESERSVSILGDSRPQLLYDYYGFETEAYQLKYPAPGNPALAADIAKLLQTGGVGAEVVSGRGWDHGVFIPLLLMLESADIPIVQVSLLSSLDPLQHLKLGEALAPLRDQGVAILGSGLSYHNLNAMLGGVNGKGDSAAFHAWLKQAMSAPPAERWTALQQWQSAPAARACHPREEHLLPLHVCAGAAGDDKGHVVYDEELMGVEVVSLWFGDLL